MLVLVSESPTNFKLNNANYYFRSRLFFAWLDSLNKPAIVQRDTKNHGRELLLF